MEGEMAAMFDDLAALWMIVRLNIVRLDDSQ